MSVSKIMPVGVCAETSRESAMTRLKTRMAIFIGLFLLENKYQT